jgi:acyl dehydratase
LIGERDGWHGRFLEDFEIGNLYRCRLGRTVTEITQIRFISMMNMANAPSLADAWSVLSHLQSWPEMSVADVSENGFALGWDEIKLPSPLYAGDTLYSESEVLEKRESKSKPQWGIVKIRARGPAGGQSRHRLQTQHHGVEAHARPKSESVS